jgi:hypothetical protein
MQSLQGSPELQVSDTGLHIEGASCESLAARLAENTPPVAAGSLGFASTLAVNISHERIAAAGIRCTFRVQATANKLAIAASNYSENEISSAAQVQAIATSTVS